LKEAFSVLAIGTRSEDFLSCFEETLSGKRLSEMTDKHSTARDLADLAYRSLMHCRGSRPKDQPLAQILGEDIQFIVYDRPVSERGLFLAQFSDSSARFVGLTHIPASLEPSLLTWDISEPQHLNRFSANVVSAGLISEYGMHF
jgi:hypothetical protein